MLVYYLTFIIICIGTLSKLEVSADQSVGFTKSFSRQIKGMASLLIMLHHACPNETENGGGVIYNLGWLCVAVFFFISGFGTAINTSNNSEYLHKNFILNKLKKVMLPLSIVSAVYLLLKLFSGDSIKTIVEQSIHGSPVGLYTWYVYAVTYFYLAFYLSYSRESRMSKILFYILVISYYIIVRYVLIDWPRHWYLTFVAFPMGIEIGLTQRDNGMPSNKAKFLKIGIFALFLIFYLCILRNPDVSDMLYWMASMLACVVIYLISFKYQLNSKILDFLGSISYETYLLQGIFIVGVRKINIISNNDLIYLIFVYTGTICFSYLFHVIFNKYLHRLTYDAGKSKTLIED